MTRGGLARGTACGSRQRSTSFGRTQKVNNFWFANLSPGPRVQRSFGPQRCVDREASHNAVCDQFRLSSVHEDHAENWSKILRDIASGATSGLAKPEKALHPHGQGPLVHCTMQER